MPYSDDNDYDDDDEDDNDDDDDDDDDSYGIYCAEDTESGILEDDYDKEFDHIRRDKHNIAINNATATEANRVQRTFARF
jgi:hypothetical protein